MRKTIHTLGFEGTIVTDRRLARIERVVRGRLPLPWHRLGRTAMVLTSRADDDPAAVPAYIREIATSAGHDLTGLSRRRDLFSVSRIPAARR
ncbi:MAG: hypothetical protein ACJ767_08670 [Chloroflexota bacterium]